MKKRALIFVLVLSVITFAVTSCSTIDPEQSVSEPPITDAPPERQPYPVSFENESFDSSPGTVASLSPAITSALCDLGLADRIVGVSSYCEKPSADVSVIGSPAFPDIDAIIELAPELLITQSPLASADVIRLEQSGIRALRLAVPTSFAYLCEQYINLALIFYGNIDSQGVALEALSEIDGAMVEAQELGLGLSYIAVNGVSDGVFIVSSGGDLQTDMLDVYGTNLFDGRDGHFVSEEELGEIEPDVVFVNMSSAGIDAVEDAVGGSPEIVYIDSVEFERPTAALAETIRYITDKLS